MKKYFYNILGSISFGLGILGVFLPLLPTTCFILLASWAFAKSSPTFNSWLMYQSPFAKSIQNWNKYRIIPAHVKLIASISILVSFTITVFLLENLYVLFGLGFILLAVLAFIFSKPSNVEATIYSRLPEWRQPVI